MCGLVMIRVGATNEMNIAKGWGELEMAGSCRPLVPHATAVTRACTFEQCKTK
jgi:hypothetical protein